MDTFTSFKDIISDLFLIPENEILGDVKFREDLGLDSLDLTQLIMAAEEEFSISIPDADTENIETIDQAVALIDRLQAL